MSCAIVSGIQLACKDSSGGLDTIYVTELANKNTITTVAGAITAFTLDTGKQFWEYKFPSDTSTFKETLNASDANGTIYTSTELTIVLNKMQTATRNQLYLLAQNQLMIIIKDNNEKYWLMGEVKGANLVSADGTPGTGMGDRNGYEVKFTAMEKEGMKEVASGLMATLLAPAA